MASSNRQRRNHNHNHNQKQEVWIPPHEREVDYIAPGTIHKIHDYDMQLRSQRNDDVDDEEMTFNDMQLQSQRSDDLDDEEMTFNDDEENKLDVHARNSLVEDKKLMKRIAKCKEHGVYDQYMTGCVLKT